jgi:hypothetical protein
MKKTLVLIVVLLSFMAASAQTYFTAAGLRAGTELGLTIQQKIWRTGSLEAIVTTNRSRWQMQALVEHHRRFLGRRLNYYIGIGPHFGEEKGFGHYYGITPITGIEFTFAGLTMSWDYKPSLNLAGTDALIFHDSGFSIRMVLIKERKRSLKEILGIDK